MTVPYDFVHYGYFMEGSNDIIRVSGYNLLISPRVQLYLLLYLYSGIKYNKAQLGRPKRLTQLDNQFLFNKSY